MLQAKNYENQPMLHRAIQKIKVARFYRPRCICKYSAINVSITSQINSLLF